MAIDVAVNVLLCILPHQIFSIREAEKKTACPLGANSALKNIGRPVVMLRESSARSLIGLIEKSIAVKQVCTRNPIENRPQQLAEDITKLIRERYFRKDVRSITFAGLESV